MNTEARVFHRYFQLKSKYALTGTYPRSIGKAESDRCWECISHARIEVHHTLFNCRAWQSERAAMLKRCEEDAGFRPSTVRQL